MSTDSKSDYDLLIEILKQQEEQTEDISTIRGYVGFAFWLWIISLALGFLGLL